MGNVVVCGGSVIGQCAAMMLAADGHQVTVLETDAAQLPDSPIAAWETWERKGVAQFRQPHNLFARFRQVCDQELPGLTGGLVDAGCVWEDPMAAVPRAIAGDRQPGDDRFRFVTGRRPAIEWAVAAATAQTPGVRLRRGVRATGLVTGPSAIDGVPHVAGVCTGDGEELRADLVVDAMGRRTVTAGFLSDIGAQPPRTEATDSGFAYYTRYFAGSQPPARRGPPVMPIGTITLLTLPGDNDTWSVTVFGASGDAPLKALRDTGIWTSVVSACPAQAHWLDAEPITEVLAMAGIMDRYRSFVVAGQPVVTGLAAVGDAWACTNPSAGRGLSVGIVHAQLLRATVRQFLDDPAGLARAWQRETDRAVGPFYWNQIRADRIRLSEMAALRGGRAWTRLPSVIEDLAVAAVHDPELFRASLETALCLALPEDVMSRPGIAAKVAEHRGVPPTAPGPDRAQLLALLAG